MTKVQVRFDLAKPLDENYDCIARAHSVYGIFAVKPEPAGGAVTVDYDASRLTLEQVRAELIKVGVPVSPKVP
jgi:hypothetical protein